MLLSLSRSLYCINCTVQQSTLANDFPCIESFPSDGLFKQFLMVSALSSLGANGRHGNNRPGWFDATQTENIIFMNTIYAPDAAVCSEHKVCGLCFQPGQGQGGHHMEISFLQALFLDIVGHQELAFDN